MLNNVIPQFIFKIIYHRHLNYFLRNVNFSLKSILPKKLKIPPSGILKLKTSSGILKVSTNQTSYLTQVLFWNGYKNFEYSDVFENLSKKMDVFFDIGSNIGYYSLLAAKSNPKIQAFAFEPAIGPNYFLNKNIQLNSFENHIKAINLALSNTVGNIDFYEVESLKYTYIKHNLAGEGNAGTKKTSRNFIKNTVTATTLSNFIESEKISTIDLIKIDTEGTEIDILNSGKDCIVKFQPIIICETLFNTIENELDTFFKELNYEFYNHTPNGLIKVDTIKRSYDDGIRNCFFVPISKIDLISEFIGKQ
jgi:FkbM family methyltransferase